jgi:Ni,Fe-hydrogenase III small subunit
MSDPKTGRQRRRTIRQVIWSNLLSPAQCDQTPRLKRLAAWPTRTITLRHLDCGSCNGCEQQLIALANPRYDMERYGLAFESSPRHAVYLAMTGPFTRGLATAARLTLDAMPEPALIAIGDCAVDGGLFRESYALERRLPEIDQAMAEGRFVRGCPPAPGAILEALARLAAGQRMAGEVQ